MYVYSYKCKSIFGGIRKEECDRQMKETRGEKLEVRYLNPESSNNKTRELAIVLVSGGMDSCVTAAITNQEYKLAFLHVNYGQRTEQRELKAFNDIADFYNVKHRLVVDFDYLKKIGGSSLVDRAIIIPEADLHRTDIPSTYVPFRNANLLAIAVSWGEVINARNIFIGAVEEDSSGYPDCKKEFYNAFNKVIQLGTKPETQIEIITPIIGMKKFEIIKMGYTLNAPFNLTWSCYRCDDIACGKCDSCALRLKGFQLAGIEDPLPYIEKPSYI